MTERRLSRQVQKAAGRLRHWRLLGGWTVIWGSSALVALVAGSERLGATNGQRLVPLVALGALTAAAAWVWRCWRSYRDARDVARSVEAVYPELRACLLTAVDQQPTLAGGRYGFLQDRVIQNALDHAYAHPWERVVPGGRLAVGHLVHTAAVISCVAALGAAWPSPAPRGRLPQSEGEVAAALSGRVLVTVEPGDAEVERGTSLLVLARFQGPLPADVTLLHSGTDGTSQRINMAKSLDDPVFGGRIPDIQEPLTYRVAFGEQESESYAVSVYVHPELERADARLHFPEYTAEEDKLIEDARQIAAVEGTQLTLRCHLNKPVASARLVESGSGAIDLAADTTDPTVYVTEFALERSRQLTLQLVDAEGRSNKDPPEFRITVFPNKPPDVELVLPSRDVQVSPLEELELQATARDDFGLRRFGLSYTTADGTPRELVLGESMSGGQRIEMRHLLALEEMRAQPDELVSYFFWAEDTASDGAARRTSSDMYFAEVRPFEEIFRQGQQPTSEEQSSPSSGQGSEGEQLAELQKQIISGTWKLIRRERDATPTPEFAADANLLGESQATALERAESLRDAATDARASEHLERAQQSMGEALKHLLRAKDEADSQALQPALAAEQSAYQSLLRLRAREHEVVRGRANSRGTAQSSPRAQQQLQQLELKNDANRYETERQARSPQEEQAAEDRQVLNRLRELARRQEDVNERLKELQSALQEAQTDAERQELARQLKRLREQQEELLRDSDELLSRMQQPQNQERMEGNRQELEQARNNVRQASESLEQGMVSRAITSGTRAQQQFEQARDAMRQTTSGQFAEEMRDLSEAARTLDERQEEVARQLDQVTNPPAGEKSLRDAGERQRVQSEMGTQREKLAEVLDRIRETVGQAEETEPLLAEQLYDTYRRAEQQQTARALEAAQRSLETGLLDDASRQEQIASQGIRQMRAGVERAAEVVLGDETEALRRARDTLNELVQQLDEERARSAPESASPSGEDPKSVPEKADAKPDRPAAGPPDDSVLQELAQGSATAGGRPYAPLTGGDFLDWSDRLREVEEIVGDGQLRAKAARIRDRARAIRAELRRRSEPPNWDLVQLQVSKPLAELRDRVLEALLRRRSPDALVPIDRDPVPPQFEEQVRRYYEELGSGR